MPFSKDQALVECSRCQESLFLVRPYLELVATPARYLHMCTSTSTLIMEGQNSCSTGFVATGATGARHSASIESSLEGVGIVQGDRCRHKQASN